MPSRNFMVLALMVMVAVLPYFQEGDVQRGRNGPRLLVKVRPWWGHSEHFRVRLACPNDPACKGQPPAPTGDGCGHALDSWFRPSILHVPRPEVPSKPKPLTLAKMLAACRTVMKKPMRLT